MLVAIGSLRRPKVEAVKAAFAKIATVAAEPFAAARFAPREVESGTAATPLSIDDMMAGAQHRAGQALARLRDEGQKPAFCLGLEGGLFVHRLAGAAPAVYLQSWVYVLEVASGRGCFGSSPAIAVPAAIAGEADGDDFELAHVMDRIARQSGTRDRGGAYGLLTQGLLDRQTIFEHAVITAMAPFYNRRLYLP